MSDNITLPREVVELALDALEWSLGGEPMGTKEREAITALRTALAAEQPVPTVKDSLTHPGYVIGSHWLETAYSRICAGEAEADVLRDIGLVRITDGTVETADIDAIVDHQKALRRDAERWRFYETAGSDFTLRLHNTRSDHRNAAIDAAMKEGT